MKVKTGDVVTFRAVSWDAGWEYDCPTVIVAPVRKYSTSVNDAEAFIETICDDLACGDDVKDDDTAKEFRWRQWTWKRLEARHKRRRDNCVTMRVEFYEDDEGDLAWRRMVKRDPAKAAGR
jgi:hypothetical protein